MTITELNNDETIISHASDDSVREYFAILSKELRDEHVYIGEKYVDLGVKTVRIVIYDDAIYEKHIERYLSCSVLEMAEKTDSTIVLFKNIRWQGKDRTQLRYIMNDSYSKSVPVILFDDLSGKIQACDHLNGIHYFGYGCLDPEDMTKQGHFLVREFYRIVKTPHSSLVHGACVGIDGHGVLICARGMCGKSTLAVLSLLKGFEYVSDDLMVLDKETDNKLYSYPIYSVIALSPKMYTAMYDEFKGSQFISNNSHKDKYIINISNFHYSFRSRYPISLCLSIEITDDTCPSIKKCTGMEKGRAINRLVHSTTNQVDDICDNNNVLKLLNMLKDQDFYHMSLSHDIFQNVEYLKEFIKNYPKR